MEKLLVFAILSLLIVIISRRTLFSVKSHGFYRCLSWECMALLISVNFTDWFKDSFSVNQIFSWIFLFYAAYLALAGAITMKMKGKPDKSRNDMNLFEFEKTTELIDTGIFKQIRHPLYSSLIFLTWAVYLKNPTLFLFVIALLSINFIYFTSKCDEKECMDYFGNKYRDYMKRTKMFIPFVF